MALSEDPKAALRKQAFAARKSAHAEANVRGPRATEALLAEVGPARRRRIAGYMPIRTEIDPIPAMTALHAAGAVIAVPVIEGPEVPLSFREWTPGAALVEGPFGARVPAAGAWIVPEVLIVPLVGFDRAGNRLGYGGGYYDRTLAALRAAGSVRAIGFAYAAQEVAAVPVTPTDIALSAVVTEAGVVRPPG